MKGVARGNSKQIAKRAVPKASGTVVEANRESIEKRLDTCSKQVAKLDRALAKLSNRFCSPSNPPPPDQLDEFKKRVDVGVKLRESWEKAERRCQVSLGIVSDRAVRQARVAKTKAGDDEFEQIVRDFNDDA
ncbi:MAG: hypothetical protein JSV86_04955 [Gemmatimonadota bacterium]|nr:MAG: hypothetical protein JSV86_04955 [Gemmatimonadota bacterium]